MPDLLPNQLYDMPDRRYKVKDFAEEEERK
jgi:hypothetical protein